MDQKLYGFVRTYCACETCQDYCKNISGMVSPLDLKRWQCTLRDGFEDWAFYHLAASPGALAQMHGKIIEIPTICMARRRPNGQCVMLTPSLQCSIHEDAPYGCAYFDHTLSGSAEGNKRSEAALLDILYDWTTDGPYSALWQKLAAAGHTVEAPEISRQKLKKP